MPKALNGYIKHAEHKLDLLSYHPFLKAGIIRDIFYYLKFIDDKKNIVFRYTIPEQIEQNEDFDRFYHDFYRTFSFEVNELYYPNICATEENLKELGISEIHTVCYRKGDSSDSHFIGSWKKDHNCAVVRLAVSSKEEFLKEIEKYKIIEIRGGDNAKDMLF